MKSPKLTFQMCSQFCIDSTILAISSLIFFYFDGPTVVKPVGVVADLSAYESSPNTTQSHERDASRALLSLPSLR